MPVKTNDYRERYTARLLERMSETNRHEVTRYLQAKRAEGLKPASLMNLTVALAQIDRALEGESIREAAPERLTAVLDQYTRTHSPSSANSWTSVVRAYYSWVHDDDLPKPYRRALRRRAKEDWRELQRITEPERDQLLAAAEERGTNRVAAVRRQALIWTLWDSGFRVSEALGLRIKAT